RRPLPERAGRLHRRASLELAAIDSTRHFIGSIRMNVLDKAQFHQLYGKEQRRIAYKTSDFVDYTIMCVVCMAGIYFTYGGSHPITQIGIALTLWMMFAFPKRHGWE